MQQYLRGTVLATVVLGALSLPANLNSPQNEIKAPVEGNKETKHIFGIDFDLNLMKNTTLIPSPSFINLSTGFGDGWGLGGGIVFPSYFPLSLIIPPFNLTYDINKYQQANLDITAGAGNMSEIVTQEPGWGQPSTGWTTPPPTTTTPGWNPPPTTPGWSNPPTTTQGWTPPPTTTQGWTPPPPTTTQGWTPPPTTTQGWAPPSGWKSQDESSGVMKVVPANAPSKPQISGEKPKPQPPNLQITETAQAAGKNPGGGETQTYISDVAHSTLSSEIPAPGAELTLVPEPEEVEELEVYNPIYQSFLNSEVNLFSPLTTMNVAQDSIPGDEDKKKTVVKSKRHAEPRNDDEDSEAFTNSEEKEQHEHDLADPENLSESEQADVRKSENSLEKAVGNMQNSSSKSNTNPSPSSSGRNKPRPYGMDKPSKSRPILGQDKNNRPQTGNGGNNLIHHQKEEIPILEDNLNNDATTVFGFQIPSINWSSFTDIFESFMGSRQLTTKTAAMGKMGKSDRIPESEKCVEDEEETSSSTEVRSQNHEFEGGYLCGAGKESENGEVKKNLCSKACTKNGFSGGSCVIRQDLMPGCLCRMPNSREFGMMLELFRQEIKEEDILVQAENQDQSMKSNSNVNMPCKRCGCMEVCKKSGSFTGFCAEKCYCADPWYTHKA